MTPKETQQETPDAPTLEDALGEEHAQMVAIAEKRLELEAASKPPSLREKLSRVAAHCAYVQKGGVNEFHGYPYAMASQVFAKVNEALEANRLISIPSFSRQGDSSFSMVECRLEIHDLDSPEYLVTTAYGSGMDKGDKAVMKAQTAALKYAWMMLLNISTGDDPEADSTTDSKAHGEPVKPRQTPEEYQAKVERNKRATLSPVAVELSDQINRELAEEKAAEIERSRPKGKVLWPDEYPPTGQEAEEQRRRFMEAVGGVEECWCGSPLVERHASKAKGGYAYLTCELSDKAFKKDPAAMREIKQMEDKKHVWKRIP